MSSQHSRLVRCNSPVLAQVLPDEIGPLPANSPFPSYLKRGIPEEVRCYSSYLKGRGRKSFLVTPQLYRLTGVMGITPYG